MKMSIAFSLLALPFAGYASETIGLSVRAGASYPLDPDVRDSISSLGYNAGIRYQLPMPGLLSSLIGSTSGVDLEGFQAKDGSDRINYLGLTYFEQVTFASMGPVAPYAGLGVGAYRVGIENKKTVTTIIDVGSGQTDTVTEEVGNSAHGIRAGARAMVGVTLPAGLFTELSAVFIGNIEGVSASTVNLAVGLRF